MARGERVIGKNRVVSARMVTWLLTMSLDNFAQKIGHTGPISGHFFCIPCIQVSDLGGPSSQLGLCPLQKYPGSRGGGGAVTPVAPYPCCTLPLSHPESRSNRISEVVCQDLLHQIGQMCSISILPPLLTGRRGGYLRVVGILVMVE